MSESSQSPSPSPEKQKATDILREVYATLDKHAAEVSVKAKVTCKKGCANCCKLLTLITFSEALLMAEQLMERADWKELVDRMRVQALEHCYDGVTESTYADKQVRCAFLGDDNACKMYEYRPSCCRYHVVISDPVLCDIAHKEEKRAVLDFKSLEAEVWRFSMHVAKELKMPPIVSAPIPVMVLHTMLLIMDKDEDRAYVQKAAEGVPNPLQWMDKYADGLTGGAGCQTSKVELP